MEELIAQLKRIADELHEQNAISHVWIARQTQWHEADSARNQEIVTQNQEWIEWNKEQKAAENEQRERWHTEDAAKALTISEDYHRHLLEAQIEEITSNAMRRIGGDE